MLVDLAAALGAAAAYGVAAVLQALASRRVPSTTGVDPRLLVALLRQPTFVGALMLNLLGFVLHLVALRTLPLFLVQAAIASSVAVTAVLAGRVLGTPLTSAERLAVAAVCVGLTLLTSASGGAGEDDVSLRFRWFLVAAGLAVAALGTLAGRLGGTAEASLLGLTAGLGFAVVGIGTRVLTGLTLDDLVRDPAAYAVAGTGVVAFLLYTTALQRGEIMVATGPMVVTQTVAPAAVGIVLLSDVVRGGWEVAAVAGLTLAVAGAVELGRRRSAASPTPLVH